MFDALVNVTDEVRLLYNRMVAVFGELHSDTGVSLPQRAVLEFLRRSGPATVPKIARTRGVTRQHIQTIINDLDERGLVVSHPNPAHQRSVLFDLTEAGRALIDTMVANERAFMSQRVGDLTSDELEQAAALLARIRSSL